MFGSLTLYLTVCLKLQAFEEVSNVGPLCQIYLDIPIANSSEIY